MKKSPERYEISTDRRRISVDVVHQFLQTSYWAAGIPRAVVAKSIRHSLCFGVFHQGRQVGFARVISDFSTTAYLADVFVLPEHCGRGLAKRLMKTIMAHPELQRLRTFFLRTKDAHGLYAPYGFTPPKHPDRLMERSNLNVYKRT